MDGRLDKGYCIDVKFPKFAKYMMNIFVLRKYTMTYLRVEEDDVCNLVSDGSRKWLCMCGDREYNYKCTISSTVGEFE